jgi:hypothetical protein
MVGDLVTYRQDVLHELEKHGVCPTAATPPALVRDFVRELYKFEIRRLRSKLMRNEFPKNQYAARVEALRRAYPVLAFQPEQFVEPDHRSPHAPGAPHEGNDAGR